MILIPNNGDEQIMMEHSNEKNKKVLLIAPSYMNIYKDIIGGLEKMGFFVTYYPDLRIEGDPFKKVSKGSKNLSVPQFMEKIEKMWDNILDNDSNKGVYDYLLVIDGLSVPSTLITRLRELNSQLVACNYLYDRVKGVYELDRNFPYYDRTFTFDIADSKDYGLSLLPIYWVPSNSKKEISRDVFGFGGYDKLRMDVFKKVSGIVNKSNRKSFIKIYYSKDNLFKMAVKNAFKKILGKPSVSFGDIIAGLFTNRTLSPEEFRDMILTSNVILDTNHPYQDGLTARFMWALGAEKKIVTTNSSIVNYEFYTKEQFFIINENWEELESFLNSSFTMSEEVRAEVQKYRIDNWLSQILY